MLSWDSVGANPETRTWKQAVYLIGDAMKQNKRNGESETDEGENPIWFLGTSWLLLQQLHINSSGDLCRIM